jgi:hypothetical protein
MAMLFFPDAVWYFLPASLRSKIVRAPVRNIISVMRLAYDAKITEKSNITTG